MDGILLKTDETGYLEGRKVPVAPRKHHVLPLKLYYQVFGALIFLTVLTVLVSYAGLGPASIAVALLVAVIKASLVVGFFMHLRYDTRFHLFVFLSTILFVLLFFGLTFADIATRDSMVAEWGNKTLQEETIRTNPKYEEARKEFLHGGGEH